MNKNRVFGAILICLLLWPFQALADEAPYFTLTETYDGQRVYSQNGYLPEKTYYVFDGKALKRPADLFVDGDTLYISDEGNKRVIQCTLDGELIRVIGDKKQFSTPAGVYARNGKLYVCDSKEDAVFVFDAETGNPLFTLTHPGTALYGLKNTFRPLKIAVDEAGGMYVISKGNTNGIAQFSADGVFLGYFGANSTEISLEEKLKRLTYTQEQLNMLKKNVPSTPTSLAMDARGLVYTVTTGSETVKRLSMSGLNIMPPVSWGFQNAADVAVGREETVFVVNELGYIMEYTRDGRVLFYFGGEDLDRTRVGLFVSTVAIDVDGEGRLYVLDRDKALVQRFEITEYASLVHEALSLYQEGLYAPSQEPWEKVARLNSMFDYAQMGLGKAYYKLERYGDALKAFRLGGDKAGYSDAYWEVRNAWAQKNILWLIFGLTAAILLRKLWKQLKAKWRPAARLSQAVARAADRKLIREIRFMGYFPRNPADAFYGVRFENKVSVLSASILYIVLFAVYLLNKYACGFLFKSVQDGHYEIMNDMLLVIGGLLLFLAACNLICSIRDGEGTFRQMYCGLAYALTPYIVLTPIAFGLSFVLTYNEAFIITLLNAVSLTGCLVLIVMMVKTLQNYTFRETIAALLLSLFTMLMILIALVISAALIAQLWEFLSGVLKEARFYYES